MTQDSKIRVAVINDTRRTNHYGCLMVMSNLEQLLRSHNAEIVWSWPVGTDWRKHKDKILSFDSVDAVIVNGEGTIHHGPKRWQAQALVDFAEFAHNELQIPVFLINATLYANEASLNKSLSHFDAINVRDRASHTELNSLGLNNTFVPDMTFAISSGLQHDYQKKLCVVDSVMQSDLPALKEFSQKHNADYCSMVVARPGNYSPWRKTRRFILTTWKWFSKERNRSLNPVDFEQHLGQFQLVVTGRYHTVTMCLKNRIPFVAIESNTPKISFLLTEVFGHTNRVIKASQLENLNLDDWNKFTDNEVSAIDTFLAKAKEDNRLMIETVLHATNEKRSC